MGKPFVRPITERDRSWVAYLIHELWMSDIVVTHGVVFKPAELPGFIIDDDGEPLGLLTYQIKGDACEIITLDSLRKHTGVGTMLVNAVKRKAQESGCRRLWVVTTNDNLRALGFYQKRGFHIVTVRPGVMKESRKLKPAIPEIGLEGIPIRDEIELEMILPLAETEPSESG